MFIVLGVDLPSVERWYTFRPHQCRQAIGQTTFGLLPRVVRGICGDLPLVEPDADSYHAEVCKKKQKSMDFHTTEPSCTKSLLSSLICFAPTDWLSSSLQNLDVEGGSVLDLVDRSQEGCLSRCHTWLWEVSNFRTVSRHSNEVPALLWHLAGLEVDVPKTLDEIRAFNTGLGSGVFVKLQLKYHRCPLYRWLEGVLRDTANANDEFLGTTDCCRDEWLTKPILECLHGSRSLLASPEMKALQTRLAMDTHATNMRLEGEFSEIKASAPIGRSVITAEKQSYIAYLDKMLKTHVARGGQDSRVPLKPAELIRSGVPMQRRQPSAFHRPDMRWHNEHLRNWRQHHPGCTLDQHQEKSRELSTQWHNMTPDEKSSALQALEDPEPPREPHATARSRAPATRFPFDVEDPGSLWVPGDETWPVRPEVLSDFLSQQCGGGTGVANRAFEVRQKLSNILTVVEEGAVPNEREFQRCMSCWELHPGLCFHLDSGIYSDCLKFAVSLERFLGADMLHRYYKLFDALEPRSCKYFYFSWRRARNPQSAVTHCIINCDVTDQGVSLSTVTPRIWDYATLWSLARTVLNARWTRVLVGRVVSTSRTDGSDLVGITEHGMSVEEVWPIEYRRPAQPRGPHIGLDRPARRPRQRTAGVKLLGPASHVVLDLPSDSDVSDVGSGPEIVPGQGRMLGGRARGVGRGRGGGRVGARGRDGAGYSGTVGRGLALAGPSDAESESDSGKGEGKGMPGDQGSLARGMCHGPAASQGTSQSESRRSLVPAVDRFQREVINWGPFTLHALKGGGYAAHCDMHKDGSPNGDKCRTSLLCGSDLSQEETLLRLKRWLIFGLVHLPIDAEESRREHVFAHKARKFVRQPDRADLDALPPGLFSEAQLACLR